MAPYENVLLVGATGNLGSAVLPALAKSFRVTVLTRPGSSTASNPPAAAHAVVTAEYDSVDSLAAAIQEAHADVVVSTLGSPGLPAQLKLIEAAVQAGVKRFVPSEFGCDTFHERTRPLPAFKLKVAAQELLRERASEGKIEWTAVVSGPFFDWGMKLGFHGFNVKTKEATIYDGGNNRLSTTTLADIGKAVVGALQHPEKTRNKVIYVQTANVSQRELLNAVQQATGETFTVNEVETSKFEEQGREKIQSGDMSGMGLYLRRAIFAAGYGSDFTGKEEDELVGVKQVKDKGDLVELVRQFYS